jgi:cytochrome P450
VHILNAVDDHLFLTQSLTHALHHLAAEPRYVQMLRNEVETIIASDGWSKQSLGKMRKLDSFLKESQRYNGTNVGQSSSIAKAR